MEFVGFVIDILIGRWLIRFIGVRVRHFWEKRLGREASFKVMNAEKGDPFSRFENDLANSIVGAIVSLLLFALGAYILFGIEEC